MCELQQHKLVLAGDGTTLHAHTNGSHTMLRFDADPTLDSRGDPLNTDAHYYEFTGVNGIKIEAHAINSPTGSDYSQDIWDFADHFGHTNFGTGPEWEASDAWDFQFCNKDKTATFYYGKLIAELNRPGDNYEDVAPPGC